MEMVAVLSAGTAVVLCANC